MATNFQKLQKLLEELFQLDQADLDFGIYRIMNQKRDEVVRFLEKDLLPQVKAAFGHYKSANKAQIQNELDKLTQQIEAAGMNPDDSPKVKELRTQMADSSVDVTALENEVFSHLFNFFRRYYHEGDFISLRRYKEGVYAIPYEGEEVKLHWANHDQYYVKSSVYFRDYIFTMPSGKRVRVHLVAASSEQDDKKEQAGKARRFIICAEDPIFEENGELFIRFEYKADDGKKKQDALNQEAIDRVLKAEGFDEWTRELSKPAPTKSNPKRTVLEKHLTQYTARNTFDYFIHKDLGGFLRRELDFYIKNEVMHLDDIEHDTVPRVKQYLSKIKVIRKIAHKIIQFLEQLENFQKKLWLKTKFVVETNYCITLDRVPEELYSEIAANDAQREEWVRMFAIDKIAKDLNGPGYSAPLSVDFLKSHQQLPIDTRHFHCSFTDILIASYERLDYQTDAVLVRSENYQALRLLENKYSGKAKLVYIDPPYNTGSDGFLYKDSYQSSSWLSMIADRATAAFRFLKEDDSFFAVSIDKRQMYEAKLVLQAVLSPLSFVNSIVNVCNPKGRSDQRHLPTAHDNILLYASDGAVSNGWAPQNKVLRRYRLQDAEGRYREIDLRKTGDNDLATDRLNMAYGFAYNEQTGELYPMEPGLKESPSGHIAIWPRKDETTMGRWRWGIDTARANMNRLVAKFQPKKRQWTIFEKDRLSDDERVYPTSVWDEKAFNNERGSEALTNLGFDDSAFERPKPPGLLKYLLEHLSGELTLDFFAGSGTTGHAVIEKNREDGKRRRFVLVEMAEYFDSVLLPRIKKVTYSPSWKDGRPISGAAGEDFKRSPKIIKYIRLESYEDALDNLEMKRSDQQASLLDQDDDLKEQYLLSYMLDVETRGSQSLLNVQSFRNPDQYKLRVERNGETQLVNVDLVETFNWLLGLTVKHIDVIRGVRVVEGTNPGGDRTLVLWRNVDETDNEALDEWFQKQDYNTKDQEYDLIYVNGDNNLENLRRGDQTWKVRLIEEEFGRLMFDTEDV